MDLDVLFFDELIFVLDFEMVGEVLKMMKNFVYIGLIMVIVIYEMEFVWDVFDCVIFMDKGVIVEEGIVEDIFVYLKEVWIKEFLYWILMKN